MAVAVADPDALALAATVCVLATVAFTVCALVTVAVAVTLALAVTDSVTVGLLPDTGFAMAVGGIGCGYG